MILTFSVDTSSKLFRQLFVIVTFLAAIVCFSLAAYSWTGPSGTAPNNNVAAPINTSGTSQIKSGALSVNGLRNVGSTQIDGFLGIGTSPSSYWKIYATGAPYGIYADAVDGQAIRGATTGGGYAGYFIGGGGGGGVFAQNSGGYYAYLGYPGSIWSVYSNGPTYTGSYSRADGGFCIGGSCKTSWGPSGGHWYGGAIGGWGGSGPYYTTCPSGYVMVGMQLRAGNWIDQIQIICQPG